MNKQEWFDLAEQAARLNNALEEGDVQTIVDEGTSLISMIGRKASDAAEHGGWYFELERFVDSVVFE